jgi:uncharacterized protein YnzC (UPF0291/DUF896 family)
MNMNMDKEIERLNEIAEKQKAQRLQLSKMEEEVDQLIQSIANWD